MKFIIGKKSFSKKQITKHRIKKYAVLSVIIIILIGLLSYLMQPAIRNKMFASETSLLIGFSMILGVIMGVFSVWLNKKFDSFFNNYDYKIGIAVAGDKGERMVFEELKKNFRW